MYAQEPAAALVLKIPSVADEAEGKSAQIELAADGFDFLLAGDSRNWSEYLAMLGRTHDGRELADGRVLATMFFAMVGNELVGRVHIRHELTRKLLADGGHIGYGVRPKFRNHGYATAMLRLGLIELRKVGVTRALVTCDDGNTASAQVIESNGGVLENIAQGDDGALVRRYWIG